MAIRFPEGLTTETLERVLSEQDSGEIQVVLIETNTALSESNPEKMQSVMDQVNNLVPKYMDKQEQANPDSLLKPTCGKIVAFLQQAGDTLQARIEQVRERMKEGSGGGRADGGIGSGRLDQAPDGEERRFAAYHEEPIDTIDGPFTVKSALDRFMGRADIKIQGCALDRDYVYIKARGNGNCFYLSYLTGIFYYLIEPASSCLSQQPPGKIEGLIGFLEGQAHYQTTQAHGRDYTAAFVEQLRRLASSPTEETLQSILRDERVVVPMVAYLRDFACYGVMHQIEVKKIGDELTENGERRVTRERIPLGNRPEEGAEWQYVWNEENLFGLEVDGERMGGIIQGNPDLERNIRARGRLSRENYVAYQARDGIDIQRPEMGVLNDCFAPFALFQRLDVPEVAGSDRDHAGFSNQFSMPSEAPVILFRTPNHFDCLVRKEGLDLKEERGSKEAEGISEVFEKLFLTLPEAKWGDILPLVRQVEAVLETEIVPQILRSYHESEEVRSDEAAVMIHDGETRITWPSVMFNAIHRAMHQALQRHPRINEIAGLTYKYLVQENPDGKAKAAYNAQADAEGMEFGKNHCADDLEVLDRILRELGIGS